ncbi:2-isopropylmalate synthase LeuA [Gottschalkia acidurici 9a]|uniref:Citramalate synthase n=1 Tax=Gottschalkia acidurici (strain ATCC 7906 / DSM 604 / BCRC 14475 / CIP 104303 / KCTC 5404 / NCIMB 10678 / 9a) TaxID=1128398 RepID=K0AYB7_GOTA9|nr:citramalate synthase [Gottschalkia acidurici]AFS78244.1 2-isopropylmalate synthase LeuA [Gottschalkia acidurici 9a]
MNRNKIKIFDSTLRDGSQGEGISFSVEDKLKIVKALDDLGINYIEAGNPGSNSKDLEFFERLSSLNLKNSKVVAFGSTRRKGITVEEDTNVNALLLANTSSVAIFGKSWDFHVTDIIRATLDENLVMIEDTIKFFKDKGKEVTFDAEHFFDGYKSNPEYALSALNSAVKAGVDYLALCDTNGGTFPDEVYEITKKVCEAFPNVEIGIHAHNDSSMGVANSIMAVKAGATQVQGTFTGFGERCGNANLSAIIPNLQLKKGYQCIPESQMINLTSTARYISEISNLSLSNNLPYVGSSAFAHKGGMHIDGVNKASHSFEHINPELVGNRRRFLMSEVSGRSSILNSIQKVNKNITKDSPEAQKVIDELKRLEHLGYQYEGAESSFELVVRKVLGMYTPTFKIDEFKTIGEHSIIGNKKNTSSIIKVSVDGKTEMTAEQGNGPVNALDKALRKALEVFYPELKNVYLTDYKVRVLDTENTTSAKVRVFMESTDGKRTWSTVGVSSDIIEASLIALKDSIEYKLIFDKENVK